jgi:uncharacterized repeat protein (TIGR01451 family)
MTGRLSSGEACGGAAASVAVRLRWLRIAAITVAAVSLASCRGMPTSAVLGTAAISHAIDQIDSAGPASETTAGPSASAGSADAGVAMPVAMASAAADTTAVATAWEREVRQVSPREAAHRDARVVQTGLEAPCPPLPRLGRAACRACGAGGRCPGGTCEPPAACERGCPPAVCLTCEPPPPPVVGPYLVCDGGDHQRPAIAIGPDRLGHLTAGDTVARYHAADEMPDSECARLVTSNCACVFAPRFGAVREVTRPLEGSQPAGPRGYAADTSVELEERREPVCGKVQTVALEAAKKSLPGIAVQDRLGPLAVDQGDIPNEDDGVVGPVEDIAAQTPELERQRQRPLVKVGFDVPIAWTCIKAANVLLGDQSAQVVAVDRGTATLRFEEPGRAELTLCKRAGTDTARSGEELDFTIVMLNSGDRPLSGVVLADALPTRLDYVPQSAAASVEADFATETGDDGSTVLTWRLKETLRPGESGFVRFRTIVK